MTPPIQLQQLPKRKKRVPMRTVWTTLLTSAALGSAFVWSQIH